MIVRCCVCLRKTGEKPGPDNLISHSYCGPCLDDERRKLAKESPSVLSHREANSGTSSVHGSRKP